VIKHMGRREFRRWNFTIRYYWLIVPVIIGGAGVASGGLLECSPYEDVYG
jgi:hypothetical protein